MSRFIAVLRVASPPIEGMRAAGAIGDKVGRLEEAENMRAQQNLSSTRGEVFRQASYRQSAGTRGRQRVMVTI